VPAFGPHSLEKVGNRHLAVIGDSFSIDSALLTSVLQGRGETSMNKQFAVLVGAMLLSAVPVWPQARNVILFTADGVGISTLNAASIYGYRKPQALYVQSMPYLALTDTSTAKEWITDSAAASTAWATGAKTGNGIRSESPSAERGIRAGEKLKTILEYAEEHGLSTGIITDNDENGVAASAVSAFYAHSYKSQKSAAGDAFLELLNTKYGNGVDVVIGPGHKLIAEQLKKNGRNLDAEIRAKGYSYVNSVKALSTLDPSAQRVIALLDDSEFDLNEAIQQAVVRLRKNPKGFILIANSDCKFADAEKTLDQLVAYDKVVREISEQNKKDTLILFTGSHGENLRIKGEELTETKRNSPEHGILQAIFYQPEHTAEEVPLLAAGPGSERVSGYVPNTEVFSYMMAALDWKP
jgi:alkaline phosphatase